MMRGHIEITEVLDIPIPQDEPDPNLYVDAVTREYLEQHSINLGEVDINSYVYQEDE